MAKENQDEVIVDLRKSLAWLDLVLATLQEGVLTLEKDLKIHFANDAIADILDVNRIFLLGIPLWKALPLSQNGKILKKRDYRKALEKNDAHSLSGNYTLESGEKTLTVDVVFGYIPKIEQIVVVVRDITKQTQDEKALAQETAFVRLQPQVATTANESESIEEAMNTCIKLVCVYMGWSVGHVYIVNKDVSGELVPTNIWYLKNPKHFSTFRRITETVKLQKGLDLPGKVFATANPVWINNVYKDLHTSRAKQAKEAGIKGGIAFPVLTRDEVVAVLEFFSTEIIEPNDSIHKVMTHIGTQLGRVIERSRSEKERMKLSREQAARAEAEAAKQQIQLSEIRHRTMIEQSPLSIQILSPDGTTLQVNKAWEKLWGVTLSQIAGYNMLKDKQLEDLGIMPHIQKGFAGKATVIPAVKYEPEKTIKNVKNIPPRWVRAFIYPVKDEKGKIQEVVLIHEDISKQRQNAEKLKESEERFRTLIEQSTDAIQLINPKGEILYTSDSIKKVLGYTAEELHGLGVAPFIHPDDLTYFSEKIKELIKKPRGQVTMQYRVKHKNGTWAWLETTGVNHLTTPNINALVGTFRNITTRKKYEEELRYQKSLLEAQREVSPEGVLVVSPDGKMVSYNKRFVQMWKFSEDLMAKGQDELALQDATQKLIDPKKFIKRVKELYKNHQPSYEELYFKDGSILDRYGSPIVGEDGTDYGYVWFFQDVTQRKLLERQKDDFISIASHELKTPVTSIKSFAQVLQLKFKKEGNSKAVELLGKMDAQVNKLTHLIGDLLDVTKLESGRVQFNENNFSFDDLVFELVEEMQRTTEKHTIILEGKTKKKMYGDKERIGQVLTNLLSNAIKYSPHTDKIMVHSSVDKGIVTVCVQDFGVGIPKEKQNKVFERFFRVSGPGKDTYPGLGLGLYISSEIIKRQGGRIWVESKVGKGSIFCFSLPLRHRLKNQKNELVEEEIKHG